MSTIRTLTPPTELARSRPEGVDGFLSAIAVKSGSLSVESSGTFTFDNERKRTLRTQVTGSSDVQTIMEESTTRRGSPQNPPVLGQMRIAGMQKAQIPNEELAKYGVSKETSLDANDVNGIQRRSSKPSNSTSTLDSNTRTRPTESDEDHKSEIAVREEEVRQRRIEMDEREKEREERKQEKEARSLEKEEREKEREELARVRAQRQAELQERQKEREERLKEREEREEEKKRRLAEVEERRAEREERLREIEELREERIQRQNEMNERETEREERRKEHEERTREVTLRRLEIKVHEEMIEERRKEREEREEERVQHRKAIEEMAQHRKEIDIILQEFKSSEKIGNFNRSDDGPRRMRELEITNASLSTELEKVKAELNLIKREMEADQRKVSSLMDYMALYQLPNDKVADFNRLKNLVVCAQQKIAKASDLELPSWLTTLGTSPDTESRYQITEALLKEKNIDIVTRNFLRHKEAVIYLVEPESPIGLQKDQNYTAFGKFPREVYATAWKRTGEVGMDATTFDALVDFVCTGER